MKSRMIFLKFSLYRFFSKGNNFSVIDLIMKISPLYASIQWHDKSFWCNWFDWNKLCATVPYYWFVFPSIDYLVLRRDGWKDGKTNVNKISIRLQLIREETDKNLPHWAMIHQKQFHLWSFHLQAEIEEKRRGRKSGRQA